MEKQKINSKVKKYSRELINELLNSCNEEELELVFTKEDMTPEENRLILKEIPSLEISLEYTMFKDDLWKIIGEKNTRIKIKKEKVIELVNKIIDKLYLFDLAIIGKNLILVVNHEEKIGIIEK